MSVKTSKANGMKDDKEWVTLLELKALRMHRMFSLIQKTQQFVLICQHYYLSEESHLNPPP